MVSSAIGPISHRVALFGMSLCEAHRLGVPCGQEEQPWTVPFHERTFPMFVDVLPERYLRCLGHWYQRCALDMGRPPRSASDLEADWLVLSGFAASAGAVLDRRLGCDGRAACDLLIVERPPAITPYLSLARVVSAQGARRLADAAESVSRFASSQTRCPLNDEQLDWLRQMASGKRVLDVAVATGQSERSLYRNLRVVWADLGVRGRAEGLALAARNSWI